MSHVILVNPGLKAGGMTVDLENLAAGLEERGIGVSRAGTVSAVRGALVAQPEAIVHVFGCLPSPTILGSFALARRQHRTLVWTPTYHPSRPYTYGRSVPHVAMRAFDAVAPRLALLADAVIALTPAEGAFFQRLGARDVRVIPHGVEALTPPPPDGAVAAFRERHGLGDGPLVLILGRASPRHKGLKFGLDAFSTLRARLPEARLLLVGGLGRGEKDLPQGVHVFGWLSDEERDLAIAAADVLFVSSAYEALSRAVIEGWAAGTAVVATNRVALAPLVASSGAGRVVKYGDIWQASAALRELLEDPKTAQQCVQRGRELVQRQFLLDQIVPSVIDVYPTSDAPRDVLETADQH